MSQHIDPNLGPLPGEPKPKTHIGELLVGPTSYLVALCDHAIRLGMVDQYDARELRAYGVLGREVDCLECCAALRGMER